MRWVLLVGLAVSVGLTVLDWFPRWEKMDRLSAVTLTDERPGTQRLPAGSREEFLLLPPNSLDARWWILLTEDMLTGGGWRIRQTSLDNAPEGREVHWSSLPMWVLALLAHGVALVTGSAPAECVAEAALFAGPFMLILFGGLLTLLVARGFGPLSAAFLLWFWLTSIPIMRSFVAGEADHHGVVVAFAAASVLAIVAGRGGVLPAAQSKKQRAGSRGISSQWFMVSGVLGAAALWISAATAIPVIAMLAVGGLVVALDAQVHGQRSTLEPSLWLEWGRAGGLASLAFYALEYFPGHMGWRLEVNHPVYALAWWGGSYLLFRTIAWKFQESRFVRSKRDFVAVGASLMAVILPPALVGFASQEVFWVSDPFLLALHERYIFEFQSLGQLLRFSEGAWVLLVHYFWPLFALTGAGVLLAWGGIPESFRARLLVLLPVVAATQALAIWQVRWTSIALGMWSVLALVAFDTALRAGISGRMRGLILWGGILTGWLMLAFAQFPQFLASVEGARRTTQEAPIEKSDGNGIILRDIAHRLLHSSPDRIPVVLSGPNSSTELSFYGRIRTLGTLYWENMPGLKKAADIFSSTDPDSALQKLLAAGVTHIVLPSWDSFVEPYGKLTQSEEPAQSSTPFFDALLDGSARPPWLRPFAYPIPTDSGLDADSVKIWAVLPEQTAFEDAFFRGTFHYESGQREEAESYFREAARLAPGDARARAYLESIEKSGSQ